MATTHAQPAAETELDGEEHGLVIDRSLPQFTVRAIVTGMLLGSVLSLCNIYLGLKIGWGQNMSITAALLGFAFWGVSERFARTRNWNILENNINQTSASAAASISSAGLVAPIPALTILTGDTLAWPILAMWVLSVSVVGVVVAIGLRRQMIIEDKLPFPWGIATGETLKEMYARGAEAVAKVKMLIGGAIVASAGALTVYIAKISSVGLPGSFPAAPGGALAQHGVTSTSAKNLGFVADPSLLFVGIGAIIGLRAGLSLLLGAIVTWLFLGPMVLEAGMAKPVMLVDPAHELLGLASFGTLVEWFTLQEAVAWIEVGQANTNAMWFRTMIDWMLWPGVALMVTASLTSFAFSWRSVVTAIRGKKRPRAAVSRELSRTTFLRIAALALVASVVLQALFFGINVAIAALGVMLTFVLAIVAARVSGETGITPVGPMGKVTQLTFGVIAPGDVTTNLMTANVTGGAASQCGDLLHDMKTGHMLGASPRFLALAQLFGVLAGALAGAAAYLILVPDPKSMLLTDEWAAPAVAQWMAVAKVFAEGIEAMPTGTGVAMLWGGILGVVLAIMEKTLPKPLRSWVPSPTALGLAAVVPAYYSVSMCFGAILAAISAKVAKSWTARFLIVLASGVIAGESLTGFGIAIHRLAGG